MSLKLSSIINFSGIAADSAEWKRVAKIVFLVVAVPLLVMLLVCEYVGWNLGEDMSPEEGARRQAADPRLLWDSSSFGEHYRFKLARVEQVKPDILVIGQSRAGGFRAPMFQPYSFYNLYRPSYPFAVFTEMLGRIPKDYNPKVIIFNLDFFMFNSKYADYYYNNSSPNEPKSGIHDHINMVRKVFIAICRDPLLIFSSQKTSAHHVPTIGLLPNFVGTGYEADGSGSPRVHAPELPVDYFKTAKWNADPAFYYCDAMQPKPMAQLEEFAKEAHARGIALIGVQMPVYGPVMHVFETDPRYGILKNYRQHLADGYFDRLGIIALDYADFPPYSDDIRYFSDAVHSREIIEGAVVLKMAADPRVKALLPNLDTTDLQKRFDEALQKSEHETIYPY
jgi:uncharacterized membrane protein YtjA (UPF0391 family)